MSIPGDVDLHFWLTRSVGRCIGLSFSAAIDEGRLSAEEFRDIVHVCSGCDKVRSCQHWLGGQRKAFGRASPPEFCRNAHLLESLRRH